MRVRVAVLAIGCAGLSAEARAQGSQTPAAPELAPATEAESANTSPETNHQQFVGDFAIGFMGASQVVVADGAGGFQNVAVPVIGARYWLSQDLGIDAGLGVALAKESVTVDAGDVETETNVSRPSAFLLHGGVPLVLSDSRYFCFQFVPEMNLGFAWTSQEMVVGQEVELGGFHFDMGGRLGGELHFGFVGLPQISLQAGVGMNLAFERTSAKNTETDDGTSRSRRTLSTFAGNDPWDIFTGSVSALLYFDR